MKHCQWLIKHKLRSRNDIIYNTEVVKSNLCDCNDTHMQVRDDITVAAAGDGWVTQVAFKSFALLTKYLKNWWNNNRSR